jgi:SAM-dependent methyltransferase
LNRDSESEWTSRPDDETAGLFWRAVSEFKEVAEPVVGDDAQMSKDWTSTLWLEGTLRCLRTLKEFVPAGSRVLDFGCGFGIVTAALASIGFEVTGIDIDAGRQPEVADGAFSAPWASLEGEKENPDLMRSLWDVLSSDFEVTFSMFDGRRIPFPVEEFGAVVMHGVYEHVEPGLLPEVLSEIGRVLRPGGFLFIFRTPRKKAYLERLAGTLRIGTHEVTYDESEIERVAARAGFDVVRSDVSDMLPSFLPFGMKLYNQSGHLLEELDEMLLRTWFKRYAHHVALVLIKGR